jgi:5,10-methylenetetrahydromethanopterin reductase
MDIDLCLDPYLPSETMTELGLLAESLGFRAVWTPSGDDVRDAFATFADLASRSTRIRIGVMALSPFEMHPFRIGTSLLTLNEMSRGRAEIAVGAGHDVAEGLGLEISRPVAHLRECLEILHGMGHSRPFTYPGELYRLNSYNPPWIHAPAPPIYACAMGPQMLRMASTAADGVLFSDFTPPLVHDRLALITSQLNRIGRPSRGFHTSTYLAVSLADTEEQARLRARSLIYWRALWRRDVTEEFLDDQQHQLLADHMAKLHAMAVAGHFSSIPGVPDSLIDRCVDRLTVVATFHDPTPLMQRLAMFYEAGIGRVMLGIDHEPERTIHAIGRDVLPHLHPQTPEAPGATDAPRALGAPSPLGNHAQ